MGCHLGSGTGQGKGGRLGPKLQPRPLPAHALDPRAVPGALGPVVWATDPPEWGTAKAPIPSVPPWCSVTWA